MNGATKAGHLALPAAGMKENWLFAGLLALGLVWRLQFFPAGPFPMNDGGLFFAMSRAIADAGMLLPASIDWNGAAIPLAYPPLGPWLAALLHTAGFDLLAIYRWLPPAVNVAYCAAVLALFRRHAPSTQLWLLAAVIFLLAPRSFEWLIMGGGMTRGFGGLFAVLALLAAERWLERKRPALLAAAGGLTGLAILSHLEWGLVAALAVSLCMLLRLGWRRAIRPLFLTGAVAFLVIAPWLFRVLSLHGPEPFLAASRTSNWGFMESLFLLVDLSLFPWYIVIPAFLGAVQEARERKWFWIALIVAAAFLTPRHFYTPAVIPAAYLAARGVLLIAGFLRELSGRKDGEAPFRAALLVTAVWVAVAGFIGLHGVKAGQTIDAVDADGRALYGWARSLKGQRDFLFISDAIWQREHLAEWFPARTHHRVLNLVQGSEWLAPGRFAARAAVNTKIRDAADHAPEAVPALTEILFAEHRGPLLVVVPEELDSFRRHPDFAPVRAFGNLHVYEWRAAGGPAG